PQNIALLKLMRGGSYYYQNSYDSAISELSQTILELESNQPLLSRELGMAYVFKGLAAGYLSDKYDIARDSLIKAINLPYKNGAAWNHIPNMKKHAAYHLKILAEKYDNEQDIILANQIRESE